MLAFNVQGERFQPPAAATLWRVRRLKPGGRGTPDIIFGTDGAPLMLPIEAELTEFREAVRNAPGRYRLDAVDDDYKACEGGSCAYLQIAQDAAAPTSTSDAPQPVQNQSGSDRAMIEMLVRQNTDMVKSITERFASVMDSAAVLIRAADGAGMPSREPRALAEELAAAVRNAAPGEAEDAELASDDDEPEAFNPVKEVIEGVKLALPFVLKYANDRKNEKEGATPQAAPAAPTPQPAVPRNAEATASAETTAAPVAEAPTREEFTRKMLSVIKLLPPADITAAQTAIMSMPEEEQAAWQTKLMVLSDEDAAAVVKAEVARRASTGGSTQKEEAA